MDAAHDLETSSPTNCSADLHEVWMAGGIPQEAVGASVGVLVYSVLCFISCLLVICLLLSYGEKISYITLLSLFTAISTLASIIQQLHYATSWVIIKQAQFDKAVESLATPSLAIGGAAEKTDVVLFTIQFYCYNIMSLNVLFWAIGLFCGSWEVHSQWLGNWRPQCAPFSKIFSIFFPALIIGLQRTKVVIDIPAFFFIITFLTMLVSMSVGGVLLILILYKYMKTRRLVAGHANRGGWWASGGSGGSRNHEFGSNGTTGSGVTSSTRRNLYDRVLVTRFTIGFVILAVFEATVIIFSLFQSNNNAAIARGGGPNLTIGNTITDILFFIPGVTASLMVFLVFGTTKSWRQYRDLVIDGCGLKRRLCQRRFKPATGEDRNRELEFERIPSRNTRSLEIARRDRELEDRVRMFGPTAPRFLDAGSSIYRVDSSGDGKPPATLQFHKPFRTHEPSLMSKKVPHTNATQVRLSSCQNMDDPVIQYGSAEDFLGSTRPGDPGRFPP